MSLLLTTDGVHQLNLTRARPTESEIAAINKGALELALTVRPGLAILYYRLAGSKAWAFVPVSRPEAATAQGHSIAHAPAAVYNRLRVVLTDSGSGHTMARCEVRLEPTLARQLRLFLCEPSEKSVLASP